MSRYLGNKTLTKTLLTLESQPIVSGFSATHFQLGRKYVTMGPSSTFYHLPITLETFKPKLQQYATFNIKSVTVQLVPSNSKASRGFVCCGFTQALVPTNIQQVSQCSDMIVSTLYDSITTQFDVSSFGFKVNDGSFGNIFFMFQNYGKQSIGYTIRVKANIQVGPLISSTVVEDQRKQNGSDTFIWYGQNDSGQYDTLMTGASVPPVADPVDSTFVDPKNNLIFNTTIHDYVQPKFQVFVTVKRENVASERNVIRVSLANLLHSTTRNYPYSCQRVQCQTDLVDNATSKFIRAHYSSETDFKAIPPDKYWKMVWCYRLAVKYKPQTVQLASCYVIYNPTQQLRNDIRDLMALGYTFDVVQHPYKPQLKILKFSYEGCDDVLVDASKNAMMIDKFRVC